MGDSIAIGAPARTGMSVSHEVARIEELPVSAIHTRGVNGNAPKWMVDELNNRYPANQVKEITQILTENELRLFLDSSHGGGHPDHAYAFALAVRDLDSFEIRSYYARHRIRPDFQTVYEGLFSEWVERHKAFIGKPELQGLGLKLEILRCKLPSLFQMWFCRQFPERVIQPEYNN